MKQVRKELKGLQVKKRFLENALRWRVNDLGFYNHFYQSTKENMYKTEMEKTINYLDMTWNEYSELTEKIKALKYELQNWKIVR